MFPVYGNEANNPTPLAKAIQMPMGECLDTPWANRILNAYRRLETKGKTNERIHRISDSTDNAA